MREQQKIFYLVRHGESVGNVRGGYWGRTDTPLTERGKAQAAAAARQLAALLASAETEKVVIYTNRLQRSLATAEIVAQRLRASCNVAVTMRQVPELQEIDFGAWERLHYEEIARRYPAECAAWQADWVHFTYPGGESFAAFARRIRQAWMFLQRDAALRDCKLIADNEATDDNEQTACIIVTHGGSLKALRLIAEGRPPEDFWHIEMPLGAVQTLRVNKVPCVL